MGDLRDGTDFKVPRDEPSLFNPLIHPHPCRLSYRGA